MIGICSDILRCSSELGIKDKKWKFSPNDTFHN